MEVLWSVLQRLCKVLLIAAAVIVVVSVGGILLSYFAFAPFEPSRDEVAREISPDGAVVATLIETNGGATTSFGYEVRVDGTQVASLYGAVRNSSAYGVNLRWTSSTGLNVEYLEARSASLEKQEVTVGARTIHVALKPNVSDDTAPPGGMLYNLERKN